MIISLAHNRAAMSAEDSVSPAHLRVMMGLEAVRGVEGGVPTVCRFCAPVHRHKGDKLPFEDPGFIL